MLRICVAGALALALSPAYAADDGANDWAGIYGGAQIGYGWSSAETSMIRVPSPAASDLFDYEGDGVSGGVLAGANWQHGAFVFGIEADFSLADTDAQTRFTQIEGAGTGGSFSFNRSEGMDFTTEIDWHATFRGRAGYAFGRYLAYATGGGILAGVDSSFFEPDQSPPRSGESNTRFGYAVGGGVEGMFGPDWTIRLEYLYADLGEKEHDIVTVFDDPDDFFIRTGVRMHVARAAVTYRFW